MAVPLEVNSSVIRSRSVRTETYHVTAASGMSTATRNRMILGSSPNRPRGFFMPSPLGGHGRRPIGDRNPAITLDTGEVDGIEALMPLGPEGERRADAEIESPQGLQGLAEAGARRRRPCPLECFHNDLGVDEAFQADEAVTLRDV